MRIKKRTISISEAARRCIGPPEIPRAPPADKKCLIPVSVRDTGEAGVNSYLLTERKSPPCLSRPKQDTGGYGLLFSVQSSRKRYVYYITNLFRLQAKKQLPQANLKGLRERRKHMQSRFPILPHQLGPKMLMVHPAAAQPA